MQRHLYLDGPSRNKTGRIAGRGTVMETTTASPDPRSIVFHNGGKVECYSSDYAVAAKAKQTSYKAYRTKSWIRGWRLTEVFTALRTTTDSNAECYAQRCSRDTAAVARAKTRLDETENRRHIGC